MIIVRLIMNRLIVNRLFDYILNYRSLNWQCDSCGKIADLLSKDTAKTPITEEEQHMLDTIALKVK